MSPEVNLHYEVSTRSCARSFSTWAGALVQWLKLPAWEVGYCGFEHNPFVKIQYSEEFL